MQRVEIKNRDVLDILEDFRYTYFEKYCVPDICSMVGKGSDREHYTSNEFRDEIIRQGTKHEGGGGHGHGYMLKPDHLRVPVDGYSDDWFNLDRRMKVELGLDVSALSTMYPPNGYIEWHNNANAPAHNLIFTYSETGEGNFTYYDMETERNVVMKDPKGWSLKAGYFGSYESDKLVYHCASTDCWRLTLSYVLGHNLEYWKDCLDYISEE